MLVNHLHHPRFHYASWVRAMYIYVLPCFFIFETDTRTRSSSFVVLGITEETEQRKGLFKGKILWQLLEPFYQFLFWTHCILILHKGTKSGTNNKTFRTKKAIPRKIPLFCQNSNVLMPSSSWCHSSVFPLVPPWQPQSRPQPNPRFSQR